jgi:hypothetical protein
MYSESENKSVGDKAKESYRDNMPESLGGRPPTVTEQGKEKLESAKQTATDETRSAKHEMGGDKSLTKQAKETYRDNMPESLGGRPQTLTEEGKEKFDATKERIQNETRSGKTLTEQGKEGYRENMPESLGGRPPTVTEQGKEKLGTAKQRIEDETRSAKHEMGGDKSLTEQAKETYRDLGGRPPTITEKGKEKLDSVKQRTDELRSGEHVGDEALGQKSLLQKGKEMYRGNMPQVLGGRPSTVSEEFKDLDSTQPEVDNPSRVKESLSGQMEDLSIENRQQDSSLKGKSLPEQAKTIYRENMPELLGGRPATLAEKGQQRVQDEARSAKEVGHEVAEKGKAKVDNASEKIESELR